MTVGEVIIMLKTLFIIDETGLVIIEKHWRGVTSRDVCDDFWKDVLACSSYEDIPTVKQYGRVYVVHVYRSGIFFVGIIEREVRPSLILFRVLSATFIFAYS